MRKMDNYFAFFACKNPHFSFFACKNPHFSFFACKNPHFDFHAGQLSTRIEIKMSKFFLDIFSFNSKTDISHLFEMKIKSNV